MQSSPGMRLSLAVKCRLSGISSATQASQFRKLQAAPNQQVTATEVTLRGLKGLKTERVVACARRCQVLAPCCGQVYPCKKCHDQEEDHQLEAQAVQSMVCMACGLRQPSGGMPSLRT